MVQNKRFIASIAVLSSVVFLLIGYLSFQNQQEQHAITLLENNWSFSLNGQLESEQPGSILASYIFPKVQKEDVISLSRVFSESDDQSCSIAFDTWHTITNVYVNNQKIYSSGEEYYNSGQMIGAARHSITLPEHYSGQMLTIELIATENDPIPYLTSVAYYKTDTSSVLWFNRPVVLLIIGSLFIFLGIFIIFISCTLLEKKHSSFEPVMLGLCIFSTGVYILSRGNFIQLLISDPQVYNTIEYMSLFIIPIPMQLYWYADARKCKAKAIRILYFSSAGISILFAIISFVANFTTNIHFCQMLPFYYFSVFGVASSIFILVKYFKNSQDSLRKKLYNMGIRSFLIGAIASIISFALCYNARISALLQLWKWYNYILPASMCVLVVFFSSAFYVDMKQLLANSYRSEFLNYMAYFDPLTGLHNRRKFDDDMELLEKTQESHTYGMISIDLNDLKQVNDTLGHITGDEMLTAFAKRLVTVCGEDSNAYRLGGDEFAVVAQGVYAVQCKDIVDKLYRELISFNAQGHGYNLSAACGMADVTEAASPKEVFDLADQRMYQKKREMKQLAGSGLSYSVDRQR